MESTQTHAVCVASCLLISVYLLLIMSDLHITRKLSKHWCPGFSGTRQLTTSRWRPCCSRTCCLSWRGRVHRSRTSYRGTTWKSYSSSCRWVPSQRVTRTGATKEGQGLRHVCVDTTCEPVQLRFWLWILFVRKQDPDVIVKYWFSVTVDGGRKIEP